MAVPPSEFLRQCSWRGCRTGAGHQAMVGVLRESYTEDARCRRVSTCVHQHSGENHSTVVALPDFYPHGLGRV
eukprot:98097-Pleurochrysis_carterae.AAC.1